MIGVTDVNGFIPSACNTHLRDDIHIKEGAAGTVTSEVFEDWVENLFGTNFRQLFKGRE